MILELQSGAGARGDRPIDDAVGVIN